MLFMTEDQQSETATFAGGCFWCTEAVFKRLKGVNYVISGYTGGETKNPSYEEVSTGDTGHAEAVQITYNPKIISYEKLLDIFWATHDPTTYNRQGSDIGNQYRSVIFYHDKNQKEKALRSKDKMGASEELKSKIVTEIIPFADFYNAEDYHQNYYEINNNKNPYCSIVIDPKIKKLLDKFNNEIKEEYKQEKT